MALIVRTTAGASTPGFVQPGSTRGCLSSGALFVVRSGRGEVGDRCGQGYGRGRRPRSRCCGPSRGPRRPARGRRSYGPLGAVTAEQRCCGGRRYDAMTTLASVLDLRRLLPRSVSETFIVCETPRFRHTFSRSSCGRIGVTVHNHSNTRLLAREMTGEDPGGCRCQQRTGFCDITLVFGASLPPCAGFGARRTASVDTSGRLTRGGSRHGPVPHADLTPSR